MSELFGMEIDAEYRRDALNREARELARAGLVDAAGRARRSAVRRALGTTLARTGVWLSRGTGDAADVMR
jgi:hypothetical protein